MNDAGKGSVNVRGLDDGTGCVRARADCFSDRVRAGPRDGAGDRPHAPPIEPAALADGASRSSRLGLDAGRRARRVKTTKRAFDVERASLFQVEKRAHNLAKTLTPEQAKAIVSTPLPVIRPADRRDSRGRVLALSAARSSDAVERRLTLEQTAVMVWLEHGVYYTRERIRQFEESALAKIRAAAMESINIRDMRRAPLPRKRRSA